MEPASVALVVLVAAVVGLAVALWLVRQQRATAQGMLTALGDQLEAQQRRAADEAAERHQRDLHHAMETLLTVAGERFDTQSQQGVGELDRRKELIDAELKRVGTTLGEVTTLVQRLERERADQLGRVTEQLQGVTRVHGELHRTTSALHEALTSSQARGQWGERMAEDVLTAAGFKAGVNYVTQRTLPDGSRPDITFLLPGEVELHMDVKFPLANYLAMLEATGAADRDGALKSFLRDVRARVKDLAGRSYVDPANGTLDCVLLFIPNEQVYGFVQEHDPALLDDALEQQVVLCSPSTLFAVLAVIRQSVDSVALQHTSDEILGLLSGFTAQWGKYVEEVERLGKQLDTARRTYDGLAGTRRRQLERQLEQVQEVRDRRGVSPVVVDDDRPRLLRLTDTGTDTGDHGAGDTDPAVSAG